MPHTPTSAPAPRSYETPEHRVEAAPPDVRPASFAQQRLWFLAQLPGASAAYNETVALSLTGPLDRPALARALDVLSDRHETLRTRLVSDAGSVRQLVDPPGTGFALTQQDLSGLADPDAVVGAVAALQRREAEQEFDLEAGPLGRGRLLTLAPERHALLLTFHHSVYDGASMTVMMRELGVIYAALLAKEPVPLAPLVTQYADHAQAQREAVLSGALADQERYWERTLSGAPPVLDLPTDRPRPGEQRYEGCRVEFTLDADVVPALRALARRHRATPFVAVLTGWSILLSRLSRMDDIVVGSPVANRRGSGAAGLIGFLVNSLPLRIDLSGAPTAAEALARTRSVVREALAHQDLPFERIVELVNPPRSAAHTPLFQTMLAWVPDRRDLLDLPGVESRPLPIADAPAKFDLALSVTESEGRLHGHLDYATALFDDATVRRWAEYLRRLLTDMAHHPDRDIRDLELMAPQEIRQLLREGDATTGAATGAGASARTRAVTDPRAGADADAEADATADDAQAHAVTDAQTPRRAHATTEPQASTAPSTMADAQAHTVADPTTDTQAHPATDTQAGAEPDAQAHAVTDTRAGAVADAHADAVAGGQALPRAHAVGGGGSDPVGLALRSAPGIAALFEAQARARGEAVAVVDGERSLDYATVDRRANRLAHALVARSVRPGDVVGLHAGRSCDLVVGILGILKAGAAYLPLDPGQPLLRLAGMVADAACPVVLSDQGEEADRPEGWLPLAAVEAEGPTGERPPSGTDRAPDRIAYVIFTSGSTGRPKGVAVEHRSVLNLFAAWHDRMGTAPGEAGSAWSSIGFDASIHELLLPLTTGGVLHLVPEELRGDPEQLLAWLRERRVTQAFLPPAYVKWIDEDPAARLRGLALRKLLTGVESLTEAALHRMSEHLPGLRICFGYGPTEATLYSTAYYTPRPLERPCPIGRPLPGTRLYLLDDRMRPVPPGVVGEVYLGGAGLARGYLNRPDLTEERFLPDPFVPGERIYRTGDLARRRPDGEAVYAGRADDQVKLRGFRIEPAEIEAAFMALPGVREAVVLADRDAAGQVRLVAGVGRGTAPARAAGDWRATLSHRLPDYMVPSVVVDLEALPLNRSGKVDRAALLALAREQSSRQVNTASPRDHVEHTLYRIWRSILLRPDIGVGDDFFEAGGTSLSAIKMAHAVTEEFGRHLPVAEVVTRPTIEALAALLREDGTDATPGSLIEFRRGAGPRVVCVHPAGGTAFCYLPLAEHLPADAGLHGIQSPGVNPGEDVLPTVEAMAEEYLRLLGPMDDGPVVLTGLSYGGLVAHRMGEILGRAGRRDVSVVLLDTQATDDAAARAAITSVDEAEFRDKLVRFNGMYPGISDAQIERYLRLYNHNRSTAREYLPAPSPTRLVLAQAVPDGADTPFHAEVRAFWRRRAEGDFRVETFACDHWEILEGAEAVRVGALLTAELAHHGHRPAPAPAPADALPVAGAR